MHENLPLQIAAKAVLVDPATERVLILRLNAAERLQRGIDEWHLPGGVRDNPSQPLEDVAKREVTEETGITNARVVGLVDYAEWQAYYNGTPSRFLALFFELEVEGSVPDAQTSEEHDGLAFVGPDELDNYPALTPESRRAIDFVFARRRARG